MEDAKRFAVYVKEGEKVIRRPYDLVVRGDGTFLHPHTTTRQPEVYDGIRIYDEPPPWDLRQ